jgi:hypothetical protein
MPRIYGIAAGRPPAHYRHHAQTPDIPETCQWGLFLRNHDELTLEMVTSDERDYMYFAYSADPRMRLNLASAADSLLSLTTIADVSSSSTACSFPSRNADSLLRRRSAWAITFTLATATVSARQCSGMQIAMPGFP